VNEQERSRWKLANVSMCVFESLSCGGARSGTVVLVRYGWFAVPSPAKTLGPCALE
jgi:hypothetical protein